MSKKEKRILIVFVIYIILMLFLFLSPISISNRIRNLDKASHFGIFLAGGLAIVLLIESRIQQGIVVLIGLLMFMAPVIFEVFQSLVPYRVYDSMDMEADYIGLIVPLVLYFSYRVMKRYQGTSTAFIFTYFMILIYLQAYNIFTDIFAIELAVFFNSCLYFIGGILALYVFLIEDRKLISFIFLVSLFLFPFLMLFSRRYTWRIKVDWYDVVFNLLGLGVAIMVFALPGLFKKIREKKGSSESSMSSSDSHSKE